jgi:hypothetical protein
VGLGTKEDGIRLGSGFITFGPGPANLGAGRVRGTGALWAVQLPPRHLGQEP